MKSGLPQGRAKPATEPGIRERLLQLSTARIQCGVRLWACPRRDNRDWPARTVQPERAWRAGVPGKDAVIWAKNLRGRPRAGSGQPRAAAIRPPNIRPSHVVPMGGRSKPSAAPAATKHASPAQRRRHQVRHARALAAGCHRRRRLLLPPRRAGPGPAARPGPGGSGGPAARAQHRPLRPGVRAAAMSGARSSATARWSS